MGGRDAADDDSLAQLTDFDEVALEFVISENSRQDFAIDEDSLELALFDGVCTFFDQIALSDQAGTSPGSADLAKLFRDHSPCLILIDEWVAYARQLVDKEGLPGGSFEAQGSFAQALTEAAKAAPQTLVVASVPASMAGEMKRNR